MKNNFFSRRAKDQIKITKYYLPGKIIGKARKNQKWKKCADSRTTLRYTHFCSVKDV
jgi:hypothetical protein